MARPREESEVPLFSVGPLHRGQINFTMYNPPMDGLIQPSSGSEASDSNWRPILLGVMLVVVLVGIIVLLSRGQPKGTRAPHPYAAKLQLSELKMSTAENFVGAKFTYLEGTATNSGDKTVTHAVVHVNFKDSLGQITQAEDVPLQIVENKGLYPYAVDLSASPLAPGQRKPFRLTFEHVSADWNHEFPELQITDLVVK